VRYLEFAPDPALAARVECFWSLEAEDHDDDGPSRVFPDGCIELIVHVGPPWSWRPEDGAFVPQPDAFAVGQLTRPFWLAPATHGVVAGARLRAGGARAALGRDLDDIADTVVHLDAFWGAGAAQALVRTLRGTRGPDARAKALGAALQRHADDRHESHPAIRAAVTTILERRGTLRIAPLARAAGWTERHFERRFAREVGCLPRQFARTVRFQQLLALVGRDARVDWAGLAWDSGFADQAHLIREFRRFTGATPGTFDDEALELARRFVTPERLARYFSGDRAQG
jgi:AraC-like DNA-binding protein